MKTRNIKIRSLVLLVGLFLAQSALAQKQGSFWLFGEHCGLDFKTDTPIFIGGGHTHSMPRSPQEGTSSICDSSGNLLFYTDGQTIWTRFSQVMYNGDSLLGNKSSTQSSLIVPQPDCSNYYYVFTTGDHNDLPNGFRYSMVDMCADDGRGAVVESEKNIKLLDTVAEKLCAMRDSSGNYWIMVHKLFTDSFYAYYLTGGGLSSPVKTAIGSIEGRSVVSEDAGSAIGQMKFSPDGTKLALAVADENSIELFDFHAATGGLTNMISTTVATISGNVYGLEFSPDNTKLYVSAIDTLLQFNLSAGGGNSDSIIASEKVISRDSGIKNIGMQLGPNGKIYICNGDSTLNVINQPNNADTACNYVGGAVSLYGHTDLFTLPDIVAGYHYGNTSPECSFLGAGHIITNAACAGPTGSIVETASGGNEPVTITWNTTPPQTGNAINNLSSGTYVATVTGSDPCVGPVTIFDTITLQRSDAILAVPNAFTPTAGENTVFLPHVECDENLNYVFKIFNRWGQLLFETWNPTQGWDGKFNDKMEEVGVYDYYIQFICGNCTEYKQGNITLLK